jgi:hypothetical protein
VRERPLDAVPAGGGVTGGAASAPP